MNAGLVPADYNLCSLRCLLFKLLSPMHPLYEKADKLSSEIIGAAIEVYRHKGPGTNRVDLRAMHAERV
jgi:hypothetical protein